MKGWIRGKVSHNIIIFGSCNSTSEIEKQCNKMNNPIDFAIKCEGWFQVDLYIFLLIIDTIRQ